MFVSSFLVDLTLSTCTALRHEFVRIRVSFFSFLSKFSSYERCQRKQISALCLGRRHQSKCGGPAGPHQPGAASLALTRQVTCILNSVTSWFPLASLVRTPTQRELMGSRPHLGNDHPNEEGIDTTRLLAEVQ